MFTHVCRSHANAKAKILQKESHDSICCHGDPLPAAAGTGQPPGGPEADPGLPSSTRATCPAKRSGGTPESCPTPAPPAPDPDPGLRSANGVLFRGAFPKGSVPSTNRIRGSHRQPGRAAPAFTAVTVWLQEGSFDKGGSCPSHSLLSRHSCQLSCFRTPGPFSGLPALREPSHGTQ